MPADNLTRKQFDQKILDLIELIQENTVIFPNDTLEMKRERKRKSAEDPFFFAKTYFPHYIKKPFGDIHREWHEIANIPDKVTAIAGPHEHGKTVQFAVWEPIWKILHDQLKFGVFIGENRDLAGERTHAILLEFQYNKRLQHDYGELVKTQNPDPKDFTLRNKTRILALGWGQPIRGKIMRGQRPDYILIDDLEDDKAHNKRIAKNKLDWILGDVYGAIETGKTPVVWLANLTNKDSAINLFKIECEEHPSEFKVCKIYRAINDDGSPLWDEGFTVEELKKKEKVIGSVRFQRHWMMNPIIDGEIFKSEWYKYFYLNQYKTTGKIITRVDPALGQKKSDYHAVISVHFDGTSYDIVDCMIRRIPILDMIRYLYELDKRISTRIFMETNFWQVLLLDYVDSVAEEYKYLLPVTGVNTSSNKQEDILKLQPLYQRGKIRHPIPKDDDVKLLEEQLGTFDPELSSRNTIKDDGPDSLARCILHFKALSMPQEAKFEPRKAQNFRQLF